MIAKEVVPDRSTRVNIDTRFTVSPFGHHAGNERDLKLIQLGSKAKHRDSFQAGIAKNNFVDILARRIAFVGGLHVGRQEFPKFWQSFQKQQCLYLAKRFKVMGRFAYAGGPCLVTQGPTDLDGQLIVQAVDQLTHVILYTSAMESLSAPKAGVKDFLECVDYEDNFIVIR